MFWCSAFVHNKLHALAHPQPLSWMVAPQADSAAGTPRLGCVRRWCRLQTPACFWWPSSSCPVGLGRMPRDSPDPIGKRLNHESWFPFMSLLPVNLITRGASQDSVQGLLSSTPCYAVSARGAPAPARSTRLEPPVLFTSHGCHQTHSVALEKWKGE